MAGAPLSTVGGSDQFRLYPRGGNSRASGMPALGGGRRRDKGPRVPLPASGLGSSRNVCGPLLASRVGHQLSSKRHQDSNLRADDIWRFVYIETVGSTDNVQ